MTPPQDEDEVEFADAFNAFHLDVSEFHTGKDERDAIRRYQLAQRWEDHVTRDAAEKYNDWCC